MSGFDQRFGEGLGGRFDQGFERIPVPPVKPANHREQGTERQYYKYVPLGLAESHSIVVGYLLWIVGFTGAHRFYYGKPLTGVIWFFTLGLLGAGWLIDAFLIPSMNRQANGRFAMGAIDYGVAWIFLVFLGWLGFHRFYLGKVLTGILYFLTFGLFGVGIIFDVLTMNDQVERLNLEGQRAVFGDPGFL
jgi:TM2 domain-containing membrane protein YozV